MVLRHHPTLALPRNIAGGGILFAAVAVSAAGLASNQAIHAGAAALYRAEVFASVRFMEEMKSVVEAFDPLANVPRLILFENITKNWNFLRVHRPTEAARLLRWVNVESVKALEAEPENWLVQRAGTPVSRGGLDQSRICRPREALLRVLAGTGAGPGSLHAFGYAALAGRPEPLGRPRRRTGSSLTIWASLCALRRVADSRRKRESMQEGLLPAQHGCNPCNQRRQQQERADSVVVEGSGVVTGCGQGEQQRGQGNHGSVYESHGISPDKIILNGVAYPCRRREVPAW